MSEQMLPGARPQTGTAATLPDVSGPGAAAARGDRPVTEIGTLPPLAVVRAGRAVDPVTGRPRRARLGIVATVCFGLAALAAAVGMAAAWWGTIHVRTFRETTRLMTWTDPRPGSLASVLLAALMMVIGAAMVAMPGILAVNTWLGRRWVRWGAIGGLAAALLAITMNTVSWWSLPFSLAGGVLVWTPPMRRWFQLWATVRAQPAIEPFEPQPVRYGRIAEHY